MEVKNPFNLKKFIADKLSILDVKAIDDTGRIYDIEIQQMGNSNYKNRALYYWAKNYSEQLIEGDNYNSLKSVISISLLGVGFDLFKDNGSIHRCFMAIDKDNKDVALIDHFQLHFIQLERALKTYGDIEDRVNRSLKDWIDYFLYEGMEVEKMQYALETNSIIEKAHETYRQFTASEELRWAYEAREKYKRDTATMLASSRQEGKQEGLEQGANKKAIESARVAKQNSLSIELIIKITGLTKEEIDKL